MTVVDRMRRLVARVGRRAARARRTILLRRTEHGRFGMQVLAGHPGAESLPVVMALWSRPERATGILAELAAQEGTPPIRLCWWNNAPGNDAAYRSAVDALSRTGAIASVEYRSSRVNIGGLARFLVIRRLRRQGYAGPVVLLDDDQVIGADFLARLAARFAPRSARGVYAFRQHGSYWSREAIEDGDAASYVGTGGCIVDAAIVDDPDFFSALPDRYRFIEDQWMSFRARARGWDLEKADVPFEFVLDERNQYHGLIERKDEFFAYLYNSRPDLRPM
ncbi:glycosyltransferase family protein [Agromyces kandeliae]|uniref:Glycosyltransferase n=1 Tax=Agromyces kandeliae TaxID=2666141 RepID=A0A6L5R1K3_9MICO|nr:hypothetical protein [Agromyces kandeliae]MRX42907.1 hypothetical protein [Agromyces kandeliae]